MIPPSPLTRFATKKPPTSDDHPSDNDNDGGENTISGIFRGIAAATRKAALAAKKAVIGGVGGGVGIKQVIRVVGETRPLAFASEGAVAGDAVLPRWAYYGAWGLSGVAVGADIYNKYDDAPAPVKNNTVLYWTAFHIPASLVIPAMIIHKVVHYAEKFVQNPKGMANKLPPRAKALTPVAAAMLSIIPVVPAVDHAAEAIMEPTLGAYLGLNFHHHNHNDNTTHVEANPESKEKDDHASKDKKA